MDMTFVKGIGINSQDYDNALRCPACRGECLHHDKVEVFSRSEDSPDTMTAVTTGDGVTRVEMIASSKSLNPSKRRDGLRVHFSCEHCSATPILEIAQHKGSTLVNWRI
jgi:hypothetical protein